MPITGPSIQVTNKTTATQILSFVHANKDPNAKLVGKSTKDGTVLYFKATSRSSNFDRLFGNASKRREIAANTLKSVVGRVETSLNQKIDNKQQSALIFDNFRDMIDARLDKAMHQDMAEGLLKAVSNLELASNVIQPGMKLPVPRKMEDAIPKNMMAKTGADMHEVTSSGGKKHSLPSFELGGKTYIPVKYAGFGATANIFVYKNSKDDKDTLAVKVPNANQDEEALQKFEDEGILHAKVSTATNANANILQMRGGLRMPDGKPAVIMDMAPHGDLNALGRAMKRLSGDGIGEIPSELRNVVAASMLKSTAEGMQALHNAGYTHNDAKDVNIMLNSSGRPILIDFGETKEVGKTKAFELRNDNAYYASPELFFQKNAQQTDLSKLNKIDKGFRQMQTDLAKSPVGDSIGGVLEELSSKFTISVTEMKHQLVISERGQFDGKGNDKWALGTLALGLFTGQWIGETDTFKAEGEDRLINYKTGQALSDHDPTTPNGIGKNALAKKSGNQQIDGLIERQFSKDPNDRPDGSALIRDPVFDRPGVGGDSVFEFAKIVQKLGSIDDEIALNRSLADGFINHAKSQKREINDKEKIEYNRYENNIVDLRKDRLSVIDAFEKAKAIAMIDIEIAKLDKMSN